MNKTKQNIILFFLISFSIYCALSIGASWDEGAELIKGKITLDYLFSLGQINKSYDYKELYSPIYLSLQYLMTEIFPQKYQINIIHLTNLFISLCTVFGIGKLTKEIFNEKVGKITFLILFFYPIFFGHMAFNSKDTLLAFCHVWIFYLFFRYFKKGNINNKSNKYVVCIGLLAAIATGQQLLFIGSLLIIILFFLIDIFFIKKIIKKDFSIKRFLLDLLKCFLVFYSILILFWIDVHGNIFIHPFNNFLSMFSESFWTGWPYNLLNGKYYISTEIPSYYFIINFLYKSPEYILLLYIIFLPIIFKSKNFYKEKFKLFNYKLFLIISMLIFPNLILLFFPFPVYDGMRLFLWTLPYFFIIPGLTIYYLIENLKFKIPRITSLILSLFILLYLFKFFSITPYQYTYLNFFNGNNENRYKKFENDYWGSSIKELIKGANFKSKSIIKIATCGINDKISKQYFKKRKDLIYKFVRSDEAEYIIMTNRVINYNGLVNCFDRFKGNDVATVERNGLLLSVIRKIKTL